MDRILGSSPQYQTFRNPRFWQTWANLLSLRRKKASEKPKNDQRNKNKESEAMDKGEVANMLGILKCSNNPEKKEVLAHYKSLPRFDGQKGELLKKWKADKTCKWTGSYKESRSKEHLSEYVVFEVQKMHFRFLLGFKIAELLHLPVESAELKTILAELPQDGKWDLEVAVERGYSKAGLVHFKPQGHVH